MDQTKNVIAAVDQFPQDLSVLVRAAQIARTHQSTLSIIHIIDTPFACNFGSEDFRRIQEQLRLDALERIETAVSGLLVGIAKIDIRVEAGKPSKRLIELADEINGALIVMRGHQSDSIREKIIGSTTDRIIRSSQIPVLVVKQSTEKNVYQHILVSIDTSDSSSAALPFLADLWPLVKLSLIHVVQIPQQFESAMMRSGFGNSIATHRDALTERAKDFLDTLIKKLKHRTTPVTARIIAGDPATSLLRATAEPKVDLIVLAPDNTGVIRRALLGSVTQRVLRDAQCDVLIYRTAQQTISS